MKVRRRWTRWLAAMAFCAVAQAVASPSSGLHDDVEPFDPARVETKRTGKAAAFVADHGNVSVLTTDRDYSRGLPTPRIEVAQRFYQTHADDFDFLIAFTNFEFPTEGAVAFYNPIRNDVRGIGIESFDHSALFGSAGKLQGYIDMAALSRYDFNSRSPEFSWPLNTLMHEIMHRWSVRLRYAAADGAIRTDLLGRDSQHWSLLASTEASIMYGARWQETTPGRWRVAEARQRLGWWDLYLGGMADLSELPPLDLIRAPGVDPSALPVVGDEIQGIPEQVRPDQVLAAEGARVPSAAQAQRVFDAALILLLRPGQTPDPVDLAKLERFRVAFESYFQSVTRGRAAIRLHLRPIATHAASPPVPLLASPTSPQALPLNAAAQWLRSRQLGDGHWQDRPGTAARDTAAAHAFLSQVQPNDVQVAQAAAWLQSRTARNHDEQSWLQSALPTRPSQAVVLNSDGGRGLLARWTSSPLDAVRASIQAQAAPAPDEAILSALSSYLQERQNADGSFGPTPRGPGRIAMSLAASEQLQLHDSASATAASSRARAWLLTAIEADPPASGRLSLSDLAAIAAQGAALQLPETVRLDVAEELLAQQGSDGDWGGSVYTTAVSALALLRESQPNLVPSAAVATPAAPVAGELLRLRLRIRNSGGLTAGATSLRWYDGDPAVAGTPIADAIEVPAIQAGDEIVRDLFVESAGLVGAHALHAVVDAGSAVAELREDDNVLSLPLIIAARPDAVDFALEPRDFTFAPASLNRVPSTVRLTGSIRNLGTLAAAQVSVQAIQVRDNGETQALAQAMIDVTGAATTPIQLDLPLTLPQAHRIRLVVDPASAIAEVREDNNHAEVTLPFANSVDYEVLAASLAVTPSPAVVGDDVRVRVAIANRGTSEAPASNIALEREVDGSWQRVAATGLSAAAGQEVVRELVWRPLSEGVVRLRLHADAEGVIAETDESNNTHAFELQVGRSDDPNLVVVAGSIALQPDPVMQGQALQVDATLRNLGAAAATGFNVALYRGDPRSGGARLGATRVDEGLAAQADRVVRIEIADYAERGDASLFVLADSESEVVERNENDNVGIREITARALADLTITLGAIQLTPAAPAIGQPVTARVTVDNLGEQASAPAALRLWELAGIDRAEVTPSALVPELAPGASHQAEWTWTFGMLEGAQALSLAIDPDNQLRESNELNNDATLLIDTQSGEAFTTEPYFSPNGDGVKDQTRVVWRDGADIAAVAILDGTGRERRGIVAVESLGGGAVAITWDGRDEAGGVVSDGRYGVVARSADGAVREPVHVTLDTDRPMALEAANSEDGVYRLLPSSIEPWVAMPEGSAAEDYLYTVGHAANASPAMQRGVLRSHVLHGGVEAVLTRRWLDAYAQTQGLVSLDPVQVDAFPDGRLLIAAHEMGGANRTLLFVMAPHDIDKPTLVASVFSRALRPLLGRFDAQRILVGEGGGNGERWVLDLTTGTTTPLRAGGFNEVVEKVTPIGVVLRSDSGWGVYGSFVPLDGARDVVTLQGVDYDVGGRSMLSEDGLQLLLHRQTGSNSDRSRQRSATKDGAWGCPEYGEREVVAVIDVATGQRRDLVCVERLHWGNEGGGSKRPAKGIGGGSSFVQRLRAFWLERRREIVVLDHARQRVWRFGADGGALGEIEIPRLLRRGRYVAEDSDENVSVVLAEIPDGALGAHPSWSANARSRLGFEQRFFDPDSSSLFLTTGEVVVAGDEYNRGAAEGAVEYQQLGFGGEFERLGGSTGSPLQDADDIAAYPALQQIDGLALAPPEWPAFIHHNGTVLQRDGRVQIPSQGRRTAPWSLATRLRASSRSQTRLYLATAGASADDQRTAATFNTLEKLTASLRADSDGRAVHLSGIATDRNFDHFAIDWAFAASPDQWQALVPATHEQIRFDDFIGWAPPQAGAYLFRLRVVDRAGNTRERLASAEVIFASPIANLSQNYRHISPNGDGVQDALNLSFTVLRPTEQRFEVRDEAGRVVHRDERVYGTNEVGQNTWQWDGRTEAGALAAEGRYRVELSSGYVLRVNVDVTAPVVAATLVLPWQHFDSKQMGGGRGPGITYRIDDVVAGRSGTFQLRRLESAPLASAEWTELLPFLTQTNDAGDYAALSSSQYSGRRFRAVAVDAAGNRTVQSAGDSQASLMLLHADRMRERMPAFQPPAYGTTSDIPTYRVPPEFAPPNGTPILIGPSVPLYALDLKRDLLELRVDELRPGASGSAADWITRATATATPVADGVPAFLAGHVHSIGVDLNAKRPGDYVTLRLRGRYADGTELTSNASRFLLGGLTLNCPSGLTPRFTSQSYLEEPVSNFHLEFADASRRVLGRVPGNYYPESRYAVFLPPATAAMWYQASAVDADGRLTRSPWVPCSEGSGGGGGGEDADRIRAMPSFAAECQATPTGRIRVDAHQSRGDIDYRIAVRSPFLAAPVLRELPRGGGPAFDLDVSQWPEANYTVQLESRTSAAGDWMSTASSPFIVDHEAPQLVVHAPANGARFCANQAPASLLATLSDEQVAGYRWSDKCEGYVPAGTTKCPAFITGRVLSFAGQTPLDIEQPLYPSPHGPTDNRLTASDWSGAQVCRTVNYSVDGAVDLEERSAPQPLLAGSEPPIAAISPGSTGAYRQARWFLRTREPVLLSVTVHRAMRAPVEAGFVVDGAALGTLGAPTPISGEHSASWDGHVAGSAAADGLYAIRFHAEDDCGNSVDLDRFVLLDATPPAVQIVRPEANAQLRVATLQVLGVTTDLHFKQYRVELSQSTATGPWQTLDEGTQPAAIATALAQWPTSGALGPHWIRLSASDQLGNASEVVHTIELLPRPLVIQDVRADPALFSPNDDGTLDTTTVMIELRRAAVLDVRVLDAAGAPIRTLATAQAVGVGLTPLVWDGRRDGGQPVPDGEYTIDLRAVDAEIADNIDLQQVQVVVDTTAPALTAITPTAALVGCDEGAAFEVDDDTFDRFEARLRRGSASVVERTGNAIGYHLVAPLGDRADGDYRLEIQSSDRAGNRSEAERDFQLDCTAPLAALTEPAENAVVPRLEARTVAIRGTASDANLLRYRLELAPAASPQTFAPLFEGNAAVSDGLLFAWQPTQPDGDYVLRLRVEDGAGNIEEATRALRIDGTPPLADIGFPINDATVPLQTSVSGVVSDANFNDYRIELATPEQAALEQWSVVARGEQARDGYLADLLLPIEGRLLVRLVATDRAGLTATDQIGVLADGQPPPAPLALTGALEDHRHVRLNWQGSDVADLDGFEVFRNGTSITSGIVGERHYLDRDVPEGELTYVVVAHDQAGNVSAPSNAVRLRVDRTPPDVALFAPFADERIRGVYSISGVAHSDNDFADYELSTTALDGSQAGVLRSSTASVPGGLLHTWDTRAIATETALRLRLRARDTSGNEAMTDVRIVVDNEPPAPPTGLVAVDGPTQVQVNWAPNIESDLLGYLLYRGGRLVGQGGDLPADLRPLALAVNAYTDADAPDGEFVYRVYAIDRAGNISLPSAPAQITRDAGPPHLEFVRPQAGEQFGEAIEVVAQSDDRDIAQVVFSFRAVGASTWSTLGSPLTQTPWRTTFEPGALPYGEYELQALATDAGGLSDPQPPIVTVRYADLTPPPAPTGVRARADGDSVRIVWEPSVASDLAGYRVERLSPNGVWQALPSALIVATEFFDPSRPLGEHGYRVIAVDASENASSPSELDSAHVFDLFAQQPHTPTAAATTPIEGRSADRGGQLSYRVLSGAQSGEGEGDVVSAGSDFSLAAVPLFVGVNAIELRLTDAQGNRSVAATVRVQRGEIPLPPTALSGSVSDPDVALTWQPSPSIDIAGYRVYRNGRAIATDEALTQPLAALTSTGATPELVDGNPATLWSVSAPLASSELGASGSIEVSWNDAMLVAGLRLNFADASSAASDYRVLAYDEIAGWIPLGTRNGRAAADETILLPTAYPTRRLRIELLRAQAPGADVRLREIQVLERRVLAVTTATDSAAEGRHVFEVTAVSTLGFESERSAPWTAEIGDVVAPPAVVLTGAVVSGDAELQWSEAVAADLHGYVIYRDGQRIAQVPATEPRRYLDRALPNGSYVYAVTAEDTHFNESPRSNEVSLQLSDAGPGRPTIASVSQPGAESALRIVWTAGAGAVPTQYRLLVSSAENDPAQPYRLLLSQAGAEYLHRGLTPETRYYYRVQALDARGNASELSAPVGALVVDRAPPQVPSLTYPTLPGPALLWSHPTADLCGVTSPGAEVILARNGVAYPTALRANAAILSRPLDFALGGLGVALAPDGRSVFLEGRDDLGHPGWFDPDTGQRLSPVLVDDNISPRRAALWANGTRAVVAMASGLIYRFDRSDPGNPNDFSFGTAIDDLTINADASRWLVLGTRAPQGAGLWLYTRATASFDRIVLPDARAVRAGSLHFGADGLSARFADTEGRVYRMDGATLSVTEIGAGAHRAGPLPAPQGEAWLAIDSGSRLLRVDSDGAAPRVLVDEQRPMLAAAWSPDARWVALRFTDALEIRDAQTGARLHTFATAALMEGPRVELQWSSSWRLLQRSDSVVVVPEIFDIAGAFCGRDLAMLPGRNVLQAVAENVSGLLSLPSAPIELDVEEAWAAGVDLEVRAEDVRLFPAGARVGETLVAYVVVRNIGVEYFYEERGGTLGAQLTRPDGEVLTLTSSDVLGLSPGERRTVAFDLGVAPQAGDYRFSVEADPQSRVAELREDNNRAAVVWPIGTQTQPQLALGSERLTYAPGDTVRGAAEVFNPGASFSGELVLEARDAQGTRVQEILRQPIAALAPGQTRRVEWQWLPGDVLSGAYTVHADLRAAAGASVITRTIEVMIEARADLALVLQPESVVATSGTPLPVLIGVDYLGGNLLLESGELTLAMLDSNGASQTVWQGPSGLLLPGYSVRRNVVWPAAQQAPGEYRLQLRLVSGEVVRETTRTVTLRAAAATVGVSGDVSITPAPQVILGGEPAELGVAIRNAGTVALSGVQVRLRVLPEGSADPQIEQLWTLDLAAGASAQQSAMLATLATTPRHYVAELQTHLPGDAADSWRPLDTLGFATVDGLAPQIALLTPHASRPQRGPIALAARIEDRHSRVEQASYRVDGGEWRALAAGGIEGYEALLHDLADGQHTLALRARDLWGNEALSEGHVFVSDTTPPTIRIDGVSDGDLGNQPVQPVISVEDAHPDGYSAWIDDVPFVAGTSVIADGLHHLRVTAVDLAGNRATRELGFRIDATPPPLSIVSPSEGTVTTTETIAVRVASEPGARVRLTLPGYVEQLDANAGGEAVFAAVPLQAGVNAIEVRATDAAQNQAGPVSVRVTRNVPGGEVTGALIPSTSTLPQGQDLTIEATLTNGTSQSHSALPVRLRATSAEGETLFEESLTLALASGTTQRLPRTLAASGWTWGPVALVLEADLGQGYRTLDSTTVTVVDITAPQLVVLAPVDGNIGSRSTLLQVRATDERELSLVQYRLDAGVWVEMTVVADSLYAVTLDLPDGAHDVRFRAQDRDGNERVSVLVAFVVDATPPQLLVTGIADGERYETSVTPAIEVIDANPSTQSITLDGAPYASGTPVTSNGAHRLDVEATDAAGNRSARTLTFTLDTNPPQVQFTAPQPEAIIVTDRVLVLGTTKPGASVTLSTESFEATVAAGENGGFSVPNVPLNVGQNVLIARATDRSGRVGPSAELRVFHAPGNPIGLEGTLSTLPHTLPSGASLQLQFAVSERAGLARSDLPLRIDLRAVGAPTPALVRNRNVDVGAHQTTAGAESVDSAGLALGNYVARLEVQVDGAWRDLAADALQIVDAAAPQVTILAPAAGSVHRDSVALRVQAVDESDVAGVEARVDGGVWLAMTAVTGGEWLRSMSLPREGAATLEVRGRDALDNVGDPVAVDLISDTTPPVITVAGVVDEQVSRLPVTPVVTIADATSVERQITLDGVAFDSATQVSGEGEHVLEVEARDAAGNQSTLRVGFTIDTRAPEVTFVAPLDGASVAAASIDVLGRTEPLALLSFESTGLTRELQADAEGAFVILSVPIRSGDNLLRARATDTAGNIGQWTQIVLRRACGTSDLGCAIFKDGFESPSLFHDSLENSAAHPALGSGASVKSVAVRSERQGIPDDVVPTRIRYFLGNARLPLAASALPARARAP